MLYFESTDFLLELPRRILLQISEWHIGQRYAKVANPYEHQDAFVCSTPSKKKIILNTAKNTKCMMIFINVFFMVVDFINYS